MATGDSGSGFYAHIPTMNQAMDDLMIAEQKLRAILDDLDQQIRPMLNSWDGNAKDMYTACQTEWNAACTDMAALLQGAGITVNQASTLYGTVDAQVASAWQSMR
ncbi:WXG100 family type VII secretion target [Streptacidiphilus sp. PB12-B1b]|uniref:WXG100 family type VII secretion target n=1 Tax=Streptacidiphilus sp. PB12-B1b TaxID=2705012 RepID=UPI0015FD7C05|nr:WXG100 family type VII secretion target [Streptacidiphilus sp. PB12-B1b]QMU77937.1 WXG100 family type VII secretion target [Streptacidiphilus sp. PB12-B1b]